MGHEIETCFIRDQEADRCEAAVGTDSWHRLGARVRKDQILTHSQCKELAGWTFDMDLRPAGSFNKAGEFENSPTGARIIYRSDTDESIGMVGRNFTPLQFDSAFDILAPWIDEGIAVPEAGGILDRGRYSWMQLRIFDPVEITKGDELQRFLLFMQGHTGQMPVKLGPVDIRTVCMNTCRSALNDANSVLMSVKHGANVEQRTTLMAENLDVLNRQWLASVEEMKQMAKTPITGPKLMQYLERVVWHDAKLTCAGDELSTHLKNKLNDLAMAGFTAPGATPGTVWGAYNAVTYWCTHLKTVRGNKEEMRRKSNWIGQGAETSNFAYNLAWDITELSI